MNKIEITLSDGQKFIAEVGKCEESKKEYVVTYMTTPNALGIVEEGVCTSFTVYCDGKPVPGRCKTNKHGMVEYDLDCTTNPPTVTCRNGTSC